MKVIFAQVVGWVCATPLPLSVLVPLLLLVIVALSVRVETRFLVTVASSMARLSTMEVREETVSLSVTVVLDRLVMALTVS